MKQFPITLFCYFFKLRTSKQIQHLITIELCQRKFKCYLMVTNESSATCTYIHLHIVRNYSRIFQNRKYMTWPVNVVDLSKTIMYINRFWTPSGANQWDIIPITATTPILYVFAGKTSDRSLIQFQYLVYLYLRHVICGMFLFLSWHSSIRFDYMMSSLFSLSHKSTICTCTQS